MNFLKYLKDKFIFLLLITTIYILMSIVLLTYGVSLGIILLILLSGFAPLFIWYGVDYLKKQKFYKEVEGILNSIEEKYLIHSLISEPDFIEGQIFYNVIYETNKTMIEMVNKQKYKQREYREYIETWVHEVKTPLAAIKIISEGVNGNPSISEEAEKIDSYIQQVLYYARSENPEKDYFIKEFPLKNLINSVIGGNAKGFIYKKINLNLKEIPYEVIGDEKWIGFILEQIIGNAIKYSNKSEAEIKIYANSQEGKVNLFIEDNGVGIPKGDIERVWDKGFTGKNGRNFGKSTGIGLYLCKRLCEKLSIEISIESKEMVGTKVRLAFPKK